MEDLSTLEAVTSHERMTFERTIGPSSLRQLTRLAIASGEQTLSLPSVMQYLNIATHYSGSISLAEQALRATLCLPRETFTECYTRLKSYGWS
jgi:hypothetical protein